MVKNWSSKKIMLIAVMSATLEIAKLTLSFLANIELVSLLTALFSCVFGFITFYAVMVFILLECAIWGINSWVLAYLIYWNLLCAVFVLLEFFKINRIWILTIVIAILTFLFGIITAFIDVSFFGFNNYFKVVFAYYLQGIRFYVIHIVSNIIIFLTLFNSLKSILIKIKNKYFKQQNEPL